MATKLKIPHNPPSFLKLPTPLCPDLVIVATIDPSPGCAYQYPDGSLYRARQQKWPNAEYAYRSWSLWGPL